MKIITILGTRPEIIRLSLIIPLLDKFSDHLLVHTGQNYVRSLNEVFFEELGLRQPDVVFNTKSASSMEQIGKILVETESLLKREKPDRLLLLGDTNSALSAIVAKRMGIPVYHMEAGNRCYDDRVPEEVNRRIIDHSSDVLMPYTERSRANLLREGIAGNRIFVTGNPILEVLEHFKRKIDASKAMKNLGVSKGKFFLITLHRAENVDIPERLDSFLSAFSALLREYKVPMICSLHPRTRSQLQKQKKGLENKGMIVVEPLGLFDFVHLEKNAMCVLSDSGTVQEECCIYKIPNVTLRDVTERPETIEVGSNFISGAKESSILKAVESVIGFKKLWSVPREYLEGNVSEIVGKIILGEGCYF